MSDTLGLSLACVQLIGCIMHVTFSLNSANKKFCSLNRSGRYL